MSDFRLTFYARRRGNTVTFNVRKIDTGWHICRITINGATDREGAPLLQANLHRDNVTIPDSFGGFIAIVWEKLDRGEVNYKRAQEMHS